MKNIFKVVLPIISLSLFLINCGVINGDDSSSTTTDTTTKAQATGSALIGSSLSTGVFADVQVAVRDDGTLYANSIELEGKDSDKGDKGEKEGKDDDTSTESGEGENDSAEAESGDDEGETDTAEAEADEGETDTAEAEDGEGDNEEGNEGEEHEKEGGCKVEGIVQSVAGDSSSFTMLGGLVVVFDAPATEARDDEGETDTAGSEDGEGEGETDTAEADEGESETDTAEAEADEGENEGENDSTEGDKEDDLKLSDITVDMWVEVEGEMGSDGYFHAKGIEDGDQDESSIECTIEKIGASSLTMLGLEIAYDSNTKMVGDENDKSEHKGKDDTKCK